MTIFLNLQFVTLKKKMFWEIKAIVTAKKKKICWILNNYTSQARIYIVAKVVS